MWESDKSTRREHERVLSLKIEPTHASAMGGMAISIWFVRKDNGLPDRTMSVGYPIDIGEAMDLVKALGRGKYGDKYHMRIFGDLTPTERRRLAQAGATIS